MSHGKGASIPPANYIYQRMPTLTAARAGAGRPDGPRGGGEERERQRLGPIRGRARDRRRQPAARRDAVRREHRGGARTGETPYVENTEEELGQVRRRTSRTRRRSSAR